MTKAELVAIVAKEAGIPVTVARACVEVMMTGITDALTQGDKVELRGFGSFKVRQRGARTGRNPMTGASVQVEAKRVPSFKPGKELRQALLDDRRHRDE